VSIHHRPRSRDPPPVWVPRTRRRKDTHTGKAEVSRRPFDPWYQP